MFVKDNWKGANDSGLTTLGKYPVIETNFLSNFC
jgi:hypothetical protein